MVETKIFTSNEEIKISKNEKLKEKVKQEFTRISSKTAEKIIQLVMQSINNNYAACMLNRIGMTENMIRKNGKFIDNLNGVYQLKDETFKKISSLITNHINERQNNNKFLEIGEESANVFTGKKIDGKKEIKDVITYVDLMDDVQKESGQDADYLYNFNKKIKPKSFDNLDEELQIVRFDITSNAYGDTIPIKYGYKCDKCSYREEKEVVHYRYPIDMVSIPEQKIKCNKIADVGGDENSDKKVKVCGNMLKPSNEHSTMKKIFIYDAVIEEKHDDELYKENYKIISFKTIPKGPVTAAVLKINSLKSEKMIFLVDYKIEETKEMDYIKDENKHNIFNIIDNIDEHIFNVEGYKHFGYLPMKIAAVLQYTASIFDNIDKNYHISLTGGASTGKTIFSRYWGAVLYGHEMLELANVTDISIASLRGTSTYVTIMGKTIAQKINGYLNSTKSIIINELSTNPEMKKSLKGYLFNPEYTFAKANGDGIQNTRNAQLIITENINPEHKGKYNNSVKKFYKSDECVLHEEEIIKETWNDNWDLDLELSDDYYDDKPHLRLALYIVRNKFLKAGKNWIDGDELASDDRFPFYFFIDSTIVSDKMRETFNSNIKHANKDKKVSRLIKSLYTTTIKDKILANKKYFDVEVKNQNEYVTKLTNIITEYNPLSNQRYIEIFADIMKMLRVIDGRDYFIETDLEIIQYLIESTKSKLEIYNTNIFKINGPKHIDIPKQGVSRIFSIDSFN
ncbi:MAG: hypothetical protein ACOCZ5_01495 [bacterium]